MRPVGPKSTSQLTFRTLYLVLAHIGSTVSVRRTIMSAATVLLLGPRPLFGRSCFLLLLCSVPGMQKVHKGYGTSILVGQIPGTAFASFLLSSTYMYMEIGQYDVM